MAGGAPGLEFGSLRQFELADELAAFGARDRIQAARDEHHGVVIGAGEPHHFGEFGGFALRADFRGDGPVGVEFFIAFEADVAVGVGLEGFPGLGFRAGRRKEKEE